MKNPPTYRLLFWALAITGLTADLASKYAVFAWLREAPRNEQPVIPGLFHFVAQYEMNEAGKMVPFVNRGALFGWLQELGMTANTGFAIISLLAAIAIVIWSWQRTTAQDRGLCVALGLILGGTLGNFYDRVLFGGVRDFLHWKTPDWPVFNIADCCLVLGAVFLLIQAFRNQPQPDEVAVPASVPAESKAVVTAEHR